MHLRGLLGLSLLISSCAAQAVAQSSHGNGLFSSTPLAGAPAPAQDSRTRIPALAPSALGQVPAGQAAQSFKLNGVVLIHAAPGTLLHGAKPNAFQPQTPWLIANLAIIKSQVPAGSQILARSERPCYAIRSYQFAQDDSVSDATRLSGYSTCMPGAEIRLKGAADFRETAPR